MDKLNVFGNLDSFLTSRQDDSVWIEDGKLSDDDTPVGDWDGPFAGDIVLGEPEEFHQRFFMWEDGCCFGNFPELAVEVLDGIGGIHHFADV